MSKIQIVRFGGIVPRYNATLLRENMASEAENVKLWHGTLASFRMPMPVFDASVVSMTRTKHGTVRTLPGSVRSMYRFGCCWLTWADACIDVAEWLPTCERVYVTGAEQYPIVATLPDEDCNVVWRRVGLPMPEAAPAVVPLDATHPERTTSSRSYVIVYVDSFGQEGAPSSVSDELLDMHEGAPAQVTIAAPPTGWDIAAIRLYRVAEGFNDGTKPGAATATAYLLVDELAPVAQVYIDALNSDELQEGLVSEQYTPPPDGLENITQLEHGVLCGSVGNQVWFSEPYQPQAWPLDYMLALDDHVKALKWCNGMVYAMTDGQPYVITEECADGQCCRKAFRFPKAAPIVSRKSAVVATDGVVYACPDGLMMLSGKRMSLITSPWYAKDDWQALLPHTMVGAKVEGQYIGFTCKSGFLFDIRDGVENDGIQDNDLMPLTLTPNALHAARDGKLYMAFGNVIHEWDAGAEFLPYRWKSKTIVAPGQSNFAAAKVMLDGYAWPKLAPFGVQVKLQADNRTVVERHINHSNPFRLPSSRRNLDFTVEVSGTQTVREILLASSMQDIGA